MTKLPKGLPPLPPVPDGYDRWEYEGKGWRAPEPVMYGFCYRGDTEWQTYTKPGFTAANQIAHYIVAVRDPKPAPTVKPRSIVAPKKRIPAHVRKQAATLAEKNAKKRKGRVVARRMWTCGENCTLQKETAKYFAGFKKVEPVFVLPADAASVERMVEQVGKELAWMSGRPFGDQARAALAAIGIKAKRH